MGLIESLTEFYQQLEEGYYSVCDKLRDAGIPVYDYFITPLEDRGIQSLPVLICLLLLVFGGIAFLLFSNTAVSLKIYVESDIGEAIDDAKITLTSGSLVRETRTKEGFAVFGNLPKNKEASVSAEKEGYSAPPRAVMLGSVDSIKIIMNGQGGIAVPLQVVDFQGAALENALLEYSFADGQGREVSGSAVSDPSGKATITAADKATVFLTASLSGYEPRSMNFSAEKGMPIKRVVLRKIEATPEPSPDSEHAQLEIQVKDDADESAVDAELTIFDQETQSVLKEGRSSQGLFRTTAIRIGAKIKVLAKAAGYEDTIKLKTLVPRTVLPIRMVRKRVDPSQQPAINGSVISVFDEKGLPLSAEIRVWEFSEEANYTLLKKATGTEIRLSLNPERLHYATAWKEGYLPGKLPVFIGSQSGNITLVKGSANNSAPLNVVVVDDENKKVSGVSIAFFDELGDQMAPFDLKTDVSGKVAVKYFPKGAFKVVASKPPQLGVAIVDTYATSNVIIVLPSSRGTLEITATEWNGNSSILEFSANATISGDKNATYSEGCVAVDGVCRMEVRAGKDLKVDVSSPEYEPASQVVKPIPNALKQVKVKLMKPGQGSMAKIALDRVVDLNYNESEVLSSGAYYIAIFDVYARNISKGNGIFIKLEDETGGEVAHITNYSWEGVSPDRVIGSRSIKPTNACAETYDSSAGSRPEPLSWMNAEYSFKGSTSVAYLFKIDSSIASQEMLLNYRSYVITPGDDYFRDPVDPELGTSPESSGKEWCEAAVKNVSFKLEGCGNLGEACCIDRPIVEGGTCNGLYQCQLDYETNASTCANPTACGSKSYFCTSTSICCATDAGKRCIEGEECPSPKSRGCDPVCNPETEYCDSSGGPDEAGVCMDKEKGLCGKAGLKCCPDGDKCSSGLKCGLDDVCIACGGLTQQCCPSSASAPETACKNDLQCLGSFCNIAQLCGPSKEKCTGATICCNDPSKAGECVPASECASPVRCPTCAANQYCDSTNPIAPFCKACSSNPSACNICSMTDPAFKCKSGTCIVPPGSQYGSCQQCGGDSQQCCENDVCSPGFACLQGKCTNSSEATCGGESQPCCAGGTCTEGFSCSTENLCTKCGEMSEACCASDPQCVTANSICSPDSETCIAGDEVSDSESRLSFGFSQVQCNLEGASCDSERGTSGFRVHSIQGCGTDCPTGNLIASYEIDYGGEFPVELTIWISDLVSLEPVSLLSSEGSLVQLSPSISEINIPIPDESWLSGSVILAPRSRNARVIISYRFKHDGKELTARPYVSVISNVPITPPIHLPNLFTCDKLELKSVVYPGTIRPVVESSCEKIVFQVDSIFPADAIPLDDRGMEGNCGNLYDIHYGTATNASLYDKCFDTGSAPGDKALRYWPSKSVECPLAPVGNFVPAANVTMTVRCFLDEAATVGESKKISIVITNYTLVDIPATDISVVNYKTSALPSMNVPKSYYGYDGEGYSPLRLVYALNNRVRIPFEVNKFNMRDTYWASDYALADGSYKKLKSSTQLLEKSSIADLISWNTDKASRLKIYSDPDNREFNRNMPRTSFELSSKEPLQSSLASKLVSRTLQMIAPKLNELKDVELACIEECSSVAGMAAISCNDKCDSEARSCVRGCGYDDGECLAGCNNDKQVCTTLCDSVYSEQNDTCTYSCAVNYSNSVDAEYAKAIIEKFRETAKEVARKTAFKRSFENRIYCTKQQPTEAETTNPAICRGSVDSWVSARNITRPDTEACLFCNDLFAQQFGAPAPDNEYVDNCDSRCLPDASAECEAAWAGKGAEGQSLYCARIYEGNNYTDPFGNLKECPASEDPAECVYRCSPKSPQKGGDYCGTADKCAECSPDGVKDSLTITGFEFVWANTSKLFEVVLPTRDEALDAMIPYKYFTDPLQNPFIFSAVLPLSANVVFNYFGKAPDFSLSHENLIDIKWEGDRYGDSSVEAACKFRQGVYQLQTYTQNGVQLYITDDPAGDKTFRLTPLSVTENYPNSIGNNQDYCGDVVACNLFDPYNVETVNQTNVEGSDWKESRASMAAWFNRTIYKDRCFTFEWPIVPPSLNGKIYGGKKNELKFTPDKGQDDDDPYVAKYFYSWRNVPKNGELALETVLISKLTFTIGPHCGKREWLDTEQYSYAPYNLELYPDVFGKEAYNGGGTCTDTDECESSYRAIATVEDVPVVVCGGEWPEDHSSARPCKGEWIC